MKNLLGVSEWRNKEVEHEGVEIQDIEITLFPKLSKWVASVFKNAGRKAVVNENEVIYVELRCLWNDEQITPSQGFERTDKLHQG